MDFDEFCADSLWDDQLTWNNSSPDVTSCFQKTILVWIPCGFLFAFAPLEIYYISHCNKYIPWTALNISKVVISCILAFLCLVSVGYAASEAGTPNEVPPVFYYEAFIKFFAFVMTVCFILAGRVNGVQSSGILFLFWFLLMLSEFFTFQSYIKRGINDISVAKSFPFIMFMIHYPLVVIEFVLCCFADRTPQFERLRHAKLKLSPESSSSFLSKLLFWWFNHLIIIGWKRKLTSADLWSLNIEERSEHVIPIFEKYWNQCEVQIKQSENVSNNRRLSTDDVKVTSIHPETKPVILLIHSLAKAFGGVFLKGSIFKLFHDVLQFVSPLVLKFFINFTTSKESMWKGVAFAVLIFLVESVQSIILSYYSYQMFLVSIRIRTSLISAIYKKALVLSNLKRRNSIFGGIVTLMSVDAQKFVDIIPFINLLWSVPLQILLAFYFLWDVIGPSAFSGLAVMIIIVLINHFIGTYIETLQRNQRIFTDTRNKLMKEILKGIKVLKNYAWEKAFQNLVLHIRQNELVILQKTALLYAAQAFLWTCTPYLVSLATFATFILFNMDGIFQAQRAFVALILFHILRTPLSVIPQLVTMFMKTDYSVRRLNDFFSCEELEHYVKHDRNDSDMINVENGKFARDGKIILRNINLKIPEGSLLAIVGAKGSGKSSLLSAIFGDMKKIEGRVNVKGSVAYVPRYSWVQNATLRDNILFYKAFEFNQYQMIVEACALKSDFSVLPRGDMTEIGEKGLKISAAQKQKISLARALYADADIYLLDDPLCAVNFHVRRYIFNRVIGPNGLLNQKTRIFVTQGITFLPNTDVIVVMKDGTISEFESYKVLLETKGTFAELLLQYIQYTFKHSYCAVDNSATVLKIAIKEGLPGRNVGIKSTIPCLPNQHALHTIGDISMEELKEKLFKSTGFTIGMTGIQKRRLIHAENIVSKQVKPDIYLSYMKALGSKWVTFVCIGFITLECFTVGSSFWLKIWSDGEHGWHTTTNNYLQQHFHLNIYGCLCAAQVISALVETVALAYGSVTASQVIHEDFLDHIFKAPMLFFENTPIRKIMKTLSIDVNTVDTDIPFTLRSWIACLFQVISAILVISLITPIFLFVVILIGPVYYFIEKFYVSTSRQLKRLEFVTRSPLYSHFSETCSGVTTVRGYNMEKVFILECTKHVDINQMCLYPSMVANRWLAVRLDFCGNCIVFFVTLFSVIRREFLTPGDVGLSISYALIITATLNWLVHLSADIKSNIVAVEKIQEMSVSPIEAPWKIEWAKPRKPWPSNGIISFKNYSTRYRPSLQLTLKHISFKVRKFEKIAVVGKTGSGKSALSLALIRIIEPASGAIIIDGVDVRNIGLHDLRKHITIIPKEPLFFSGSVRMNLDPLDKYSDRELWTALEHTHLKHIIADLSNGIYSDIKKARAKMSFGEQQLFWFARAIIRKTKILILDEAIASVDLETKMFVQKIIRQKFNACTVFNITHHLSTIMEYDRVLVMSGGAIGEFQKPRVLLRNTSSLFYGMVHDELLS